MEDQSQNQPQKDTSPAQPVDASPDSATSAPDQASTEAAQSENVPSQADEVGGTQDQPQDPSSSSPGDGSDQQS